MKILNRKEFSKLPSNTLYQKYKPRCTEDIGIFMEFWDLGEGLSGDFIYQDIDGRGAIKSAGSEDAWNILDNALKNKTSFDLDFNCNSRDGCFDEDQLFLVWEKKDVSQLIERLKECL